YNVCFKPWLKRFLNKETVSDECQSLFAAYKKCIVQSAERKGIDISNWKIDDKTSK
ncbi:MAG: Mitochondrial distribution and morphology protein 35, partial [Paramarteilia canceri]